MPLTSCIEAQVYTGLAREPKTGGFLACAAGAIRDARGVGRRSTRQGYVMGLRKSSRLVSWSRRAQGIGVALAIGFPRLGAAGEVDRFTEILRFPVTADRDTFSVGLSRDVLLNIGRSVDVHGHRMGWDLAAVDRRLNGHPNFFYDCLCGHGPRPNDLYAWHFASHQYPSERRLPVYGYPLEVRVRCQDCEVREVGRQDVEFVSGTVEIGLRRLAKSNPRQLRLSDVVEGRDHE
jgi:hypothetical protein